MKKIYVVEWDEIEFGWGTRTEGYSFHLSLEEAEEYKTLKTEQTENFRWEGDQAKVHEVNDEKYEIIKKRIEASEEKLGIKSGQLNFTEAINEICGR